MREQEIPKCPHCREEMKKWTTPPLSTWSSAWQWVCFNDECPYFVKGWDWIWNNYHRKASYRHALDPATGQKCPVPVKSKIALRDSIIEE